jgi:hypothetical protein
MVICCGPRSGVANCVRNSETSSITSALVWNSFEACSFLGPLSTSSVSSRRYIVRSFPAMRHSTASQRDGGGAPAGSAKSTPWRQRGAAGRHVCADTGARTRRCRAFPPRRRSPRAQPSGAMTLADVAAKTDTLTIACSRCDRAGQYPLAALTERYRPWFTVPGLLRTLVGLSEAAVSVDLRLVWRSLPRSGGAVWHWIPLRLNKGAVETRAPGTRVGPCRALSIVTATLSSGVGHACKEWRAIATRYDKTATSYAAGIATAATLDWFKSSR